MVRSKSEFEKSHRRESYINGMVGYGGKCQLWTAGAITGSGHTTMRVSVPHIPQSILSAKALLPPVSRQEAIQKLGEFIKSGNLTVLTGAGVSVDSGIRAYRGPDGRYMNPNYK